MLSLAVSCPLTAGAAPLLRSPPLSDGQCRLPPFLISQALGLRGDDDDGAHSDSIGGWAEVADSGPPPTRTD
eukprot:7293698-Prymnesium_polylepis.1